MIKKRKIDLYNKSIKRNKRHKKIYVHNCFLILHMLKVLIIFILLLLLYILTKSKQLTSNESNELEKQKHLENQNNEKNLENKNNLGKEKNSENGKNSENEKNLENIFNIEQDNYHYFSCFVAIGKLENRYARELVEYYLSMGVEQFYFGDDNEVGTEQLSDVLQDYIDKKKVNIYKIRQFNMSQQALFENVFLKIKHKCDWIFFYDFDEYL